MAWLPNPIVCDACGVVKRPSNHWWYALIEPNVSGGPDPLFHLRPWNELAEDRAKPYKHICGQACAIRLLNEFMGGSTEPTPTADKRTSDPNPQPASIQQQKEGETEC
jgi:hypothetical protein